MNGARGVAGSMPVPRTHSRGRFMGRVSLCIALFVALCSMRLWAQPAGGDGGGGDDGVSVLLPMLAENNDPQFQLDILKGINSAMEGRRKIAAPREWAAVRDKLFASASRDVRAQAQSLAVVFGDVAAFDLMRKIGRASCRERVCYVV